MIFFRYKPFVKLPVIGFLIFILIYCSSINAQPLLNGIATHTELGKEQFIAGLYSSTLNEDAKSILLSNESKSIEVRVTAERFSSRRFKRMWIEGMAINASSVELANQSNNMAKFSNLLKIKLIAGDVFTISRNTEYVTVSLNSVELGVIDDTSFFDLLLRTWIGPVPLSSEFRDNLLMAGNVDDELLNRFQATRPSDDRVLAIDEGIKELRQATAVKQKDETVIAAPQLSIAAPVAPIAPPAQIDSGPRIEAPQLSLEEPKLDPAPISESESEIASVSGGEATPAPVTTQAPSPATPAPVVAKLDKPSTESIFDEEDQEEFTAANLLEQQLYIAALKRWSQKHLRYPRTSLNKGHEGNVRLEITINRKGKVIDLDTLEKSKHKLLNKEAKAAVKRATPFPKMPELLSGDTFTFTLPIAFKLVAK